MTESDMPASERNDAPVVHEQRPSGQHVRYVYLPRSDGGWSRVKNIKTDAGWHVSGHMMVDSIGFENLPPEVIDNSGGPDE